MLFQQTGKILHRGVLYVRFQPYSNHDSSLWHILFQRANNMLLTTNDMEPTRLPIAGSISTSVAIEDTEKAGVWKPWERRLKYMGILPNYYKNSFTYFHTGSPSLHPHNGTRSSFKLERSNILVCIRLGQCVSHSFPKQLHDPTFPKSRGNFHRGYPTFAWTSFNRIFAYRLLQNRWRTYRLWIDDCLK